MKRFLSPWLVLPLLFAAGIAAAAAGRPPVLREPGPVEPGMRVGAPRVDGRRSAALRAEGGGELSPGAAREVARVYLGGTAVAAVPFRLPGEEGRRIAVLRELTDGAPDGEGEFEVVILRGGRGSYETVRTPLTAYGPAPDAEPYFGVADVTLDGSPEVYVVSRALTGAGFLVEVDVYDAREAAAFGVSVGGGYGDAAREVAWSGEPGPHVRAWLRDRADSAAAAAVAERREGDGRIFFRRAVERWAARNGRGFHTGPPMFDRIPGPVPLAARAYCAVEDGGTVWSTFRHGGVWAYDRAADRHHVVMLPRDVYEWAPSLVVGKELVWIAQTAPVGRAAGLVVWGKRTETLYVVPIPELRLEAGAGCDREACRAGVLSVRGGVLHEDGRPLSLPGYVARGEFESAKSCPAVAADAGTPPVREPALMPGATRPSVYLPGIDAGPPKASPSAIR